MCPAGAIAAAKQAQSRAVGARVLEIRGSFDEALASCLELAGAARSCSSTRSTRTGSRARRPRRSRSSRSSAGRRTCSRCRTAAAATRVAYAKGFAEEGAHPRLVSAQAAERAVTLASAIRIVEPAHLAEVDELIANERVEHRHGLRPEITDAWLEIASREGMFCEPSSAAGYAGLSHVELEPGRTVVVVLTGHGLKDTAAVEVLTEGATVIDASLDAILAEVGR